MPKTITLEWLEEEYACGDQIEIFKRVFGDSAELNETNAVKAIEAEFDLGWLAEHVLTEGVGDEFNQIRAVAWNEYNKVTSVAWNKYHKLRVAAWAAYERDGDGCDEYHRIKDLAAAEYRHVQVTALADRNRIIATAILSLIK